MDLYLIRHGIAAERGLYSRDAERPLTDKGMRRSRAVAQRLKSLGFQFDLLLSSDLVRAQQTAAILCQEQLAEQFSKISALAPEGLLQDGLRQMATLSESLQARGSKADLSIALVGHQPNLSEWAEALVWGTQFEGTDTLGGEHLLLKKAGIIGVHLPEDWPIESPIGRSHMFWLTPPRLIL